MQKRTVEPFEKVESVSCFLAMIPPTITDQQHRLGVNRKTGKPYVYKQQALVDARQKFEAYLAKHVPPVPFTGPVQLVVKWCYPVKGSHRNGEWKTSKPDTDNSEKMLKDVMTELGYWKDDAQVCSEIVQKFWASIPGIYIQIESLNHEV